MTVLAVAALVMFVTGSVLIGWWARDWRQSNAQNLWMALGEVT